MFLPEVEASACKLFSDGALVLAACAVGGSNLLLHELASDARARAHQAVAPAACGGGKGRVGKVRVKPKGGMGRQ